jgi:uncharacterized membrane protein HdeD (DUF308 family)
MASFMPWTAGLREFATYWSWFFALGILMIILGALAVGSSLTPTFFSLVFLGWLLIFAAILVGLLYMRVGFQVQMGRAFPASSLVVGFMLVANPGASTLTVTLLLAIFFLISGIFRIFASLSMRFPQWGWVLVNGVVTVVLGIMILLRWPASGFQIIGFFIGIDLFLNGWAWVMLSVAARRLLGPVSLDGSFVVNDLIQDK